MGKISQGRIKQIIREEILKKNNKKKVLSESVQSDLKKLETALGKLGCDINVEGGKESQGELIMTSQANGLT